MSLTRSQYDAVMRLYDRRQIEDHRIMEERRRKAYAAIPELASIDAGVADAAVRRLRGLFGLEPKETVDAGSPVQSGSAPSIRSRAQGESGRQALLRVWTQRMRKQLSPRQPCPRRLRSGRS